MIREKIAEILRTINPELVDYKGNNMLEDGLLESVHIMEIVAEIEEIFDIEVAPDYIIPEYFFNIDTLEKLVIEIKDI